MNQFKKLSRVRSARRAMANLEVVMTVAVMLPIAAVMLFLGVKILTTLYQCVGALVAWPFL
jgi:hypothetical protein